LKGYAIDQVESARYLGIHFHCGKHFKTAYQGIQKCSLWSCFTLIYVISTYDYCQHADSGCFKI